MDESIREVVAYVMYGATLGLAIVEAVLQHRWNRWYFGTGLRIFHREIQAPVSKGLPLSPSLLDLQLGERQYPRIDFKKLATEELAFRERSRLKFLLLIDGLYVLHGLVRRDPYSGCVRVEGRINWAALWYPVLAIYIVVFEIWKPEMTLLDLLPTVLFTIVVVLSVYGAERFGYNKVADAIQAQLGGAPPGKRPIHPE